MTNITDSTGKEQTIKVRCEKCKGQGSTDGHLNPCLHCGGFGFTREVFKLAPPPKTLRQQLEEADPNAAS